MAKKNNNFQPASVLANTLPANPNINSSEIGNFSAVLRDISRKSYDTRLKNDSQNNAMTGAGAKPSDVSGSTFASVMNNLESMTGGDVSKEYAAGVQQFSAAATARENQINDSFTNNYKKLQTATAFANLGGTSIFIPSGTLADRNNNPGNLRFVGQPGASPGQGGFAQFASPEQGYEALKNQISLDASRGMTVAQFVSKYAPPSENDTNTYISQFLQELGVTADTKLSDVSVDEVAQFMAKKESGTQVLGGGSSSGTAMGTTGSPTMDTSAPGYYSKTLPGLTLSQGGVDVAAMQVASGNPMPSLGLGSKTSIANTRTAIINRAAELVQGIAPGANKATLQANAASLKQQTEYKNTTEQALTKAEAGFTQVMDAFKGAGINTSDSQMLNIGINEIRKRLTGGQIFAFDAGLTEIANDYALVFARGGQRSQAGNELAQNVVNANISIKDLMAVQSELQAQGQTVITSANSQIGKIQGQLNTMFTNTNSPTTNDTQFGQSKVITYQGKDYNVDANGNMTPIQ